MYRLCVVDVYLDVSFCVYAHRGRAFARSLAVAAIRVLDADVSGATVVHRLCLRRTVLKPFRCPIN